MTDLSPDQPVLLHAVVERVVGSLVEARVGHASSQVVSADIVKSLPETVSWCGRTWTVLARDGGEVWIRCGGMRIAVPAEWIEQQQAEVPL